MKIKNNIIINFNNKKQFKNLKNRIDIFYKDLEVYPKEYKILYYFSKKIDTRILLKENNLIIFTENKNLIEVIDELPFLCKTIVVYDSENDTFNYMEYGKDINKNIKATREEA